MTESKENPAFRPFSAAGPPTRRIASHRGAASAQSAGGTGTPSLAAHAYPDRRRRQHSGRRPVPVLAPQRLCRGRRARWAGRRFGAGGPGLRPAHP
ncbi:hypothetical protein G6F59_018527 [Rhizopus arrhizus]|nr:hypothetical protein G6F59_018527 [Rhizopus arrhizus]